MPTASHRASSDLRNPSSHHPRAGRLLVLLATSMVASLVVTDGTPAALRVRPQQSVSGPVTLTVESGFISLTSSSTPLESLTITRRATVALNPGENGRGLDAVITSESLTSPSETGSPTPGSIPVVLVHGTAENQKYWDAMTTSLHDAGMKAFTFEYGQKGFQGLVGSIGQKIGLRGFGDVEVSTQQLADEVATVLDRTGAGKVDLVGHSQGGLLIKNFVAQDKSDRVANVVQLAPSTHGTTFSGLADFIGPVGNSVDINGWKPVKDVIYTAASTLAWPSLAQQTVGSRFLEKLDKLPDTKPGVDYLVVSTKDDVVATPYRAQFITAAPGSTAVNMEVHSLPGVPRDGAVDHGLNTGDVISAVTNYLKSSQSAPRTADQVKANPGTTLTRDGGTTTVSEGGKVVATIDEQPGTAQQNPAKQSREPVGKSVTGTTVTTPSGATLAVAGRDVTLKRNGQSVSISEAHGVTVANSPAERAPSSKSSAPADHPIKADQKPSVPQPTGITPKIGIGANGVAERSGTTTGTKPAEHPTGGTATDSPSTKASKTATSSTDSATSGTATTSTGTGVHATNGTSTRTGSSSSLGGQQSSTPKATTSTSGSGPRSAAGSGDSKAGHSGAGSSPDSGNHKKSTDGPSHEHAAGNS
ncbi:MULTISPECIES: triacylglycerol lipase [Mycobacteroides]|uniref:Triacylglycerol lipase n=1 Tax=Mycobacteroides chelonae TaxID=1774 RepID=A0A1S1LRH0_MYCCH|nr:MULTISPECIES: alpha/beta fold hydrolase [Mycobacteroides]KRQ24654.1 triacylglycerol lipase [Mycobacteroides sp. H003]KRQ37508.1 triacylglycerol lipase [Mycobacteroides sp. H092]KRQ45032.1 triacylglycerol lipase [Mycobacteroides sp. H101]KRQ47962.1 triacylglycerol lipase [Mycobacteroides sp. H063]KRQ58571.1 triacylglycerol lipase [Mycobacteroides sp. H070]